jgi:hypothetical protein
VIERGELLTRLGDTVSRLDDAQFARVRTEAEDIERRWPGPEYERERAVALTATARWLLGEMTTVEAGRAMIETYEHAALALAAARQIARMAVLEGVPEQEAAREAGVDLETIRRDVGRGHAVL